MSKAERIRQQNAREKIAAQQAAARRSEQRRRLLISGAAVVAVLAVVVVLVVVKLSSSPASTKPTAAGGDSQPASVVNDITHVPAAALDKIGAGTTYPKAIQPISGNAALLKRNGKPLMVYVGGEYCPYCAAERWGMAIALSRFGTLTGLGFIHSSSSDVYANTPTLTFYHAKYSSKYLEFQPIEARNLTNTANLEPIPAQVSDLMKKYDVPPYVPSSQYDGSFPFVDFGNKYVIAGASYDPSVLAGKTWSQVASALSDPSSPVATGADGAANLISAAICKMTGGQPGNVCNSPGVVTASGKL